MNRFDIQVAEPTFDVEHDSYLMYCFVMFHENWRCYSKTAYPHFETLADRFIEIHSRIPSAIGIPILGVRPMYLFSNRVGLHDGVRTCGAVWLNGAYVYSVATRSPEMYDELLFVDEDTARQYGYPDEGYIYMTDVMSRVEADRGKVLDLVKDAVNKNPNLPTNEEELRQYLAPKQKSQKSESAETTDES